MQPKHHTPVPSCHFPGYFTAAELLLLLTPLLALIRNNSHSIFGTFIQTSGSVKGQSSLGQAAKIGLKTQKQVAS